MTKLLLRFFQLKRKTRNHSYMVKCEDGVWAKVIVIKK